MGSFVEVNKRSLVVRVENRKMKRWLRDHPSTRCNRGKIRKFSKSSQKRLARIISNNAERFRYFFTVTYRMNHRDCKISKAHIDRFLTRFRKACGSIVGYVWVLEFQKRGAVHFHIWFDEFEVQRFSEWLNMIVRKQILNRFKGDDKNIERFKFLTYLWLVVTGQLGDEKAVKAATDLKVIVSCKFIKGYAIKYAWKEEQKEYHGNVDLDTGEIVESWTGRFWGGSRSVKNEKLFYSDDISDVRTFRRWIKSTKGMKNFSGTWILWNEDARNRVKKIGNDLKLVKAARNLQNSDL
jgi:hypothetical protein